MTQLTLTQDQAETLLDMIESATAGIWPVVRQDMERMGYSPELMVLAVRVLAYQAGRDPFLSMSDFDPC